MKSYLWIIRYWSVQYAALSPYASPFAKIAARLEFEQIGNFDCVHDGLHAIAEIADVTLTVVAEKVQAVFYLIFKKINISYSLENEQ